MSSSRQLTILFLMLMILGGVTTAQETPADSDQSTQSEESDGPGDLTDDAAGEPADDPGEDPAEDPLADPFEDPLADPFEDSLFDDPFQTDEPSGPDDGPTGVDFFADPFATSEDPLAEDTDLLSQPVPRDAGTDRQSTDDIFALDDLDSLFATDELIEESSEQPDETTTTDLLETEGVRWGGRIGGSVSGDWSWDDVWTPEFQFFSPSSQTLSPSIGATLFFDARPNQEFRAFGKLRIDTTTDGGFDLGGLTLDAGTIAPALPDGWTSEENEDGDTEIRDENGDLVITIPGTGDDPDAEEDPVEEEDPGTTGTAPGIAIEVPELFADYVWTDRLFFRFGKHTIKWGTGYFFSPADVLNLTAVDAEDPTAEREGPLSLRIQYPFGLTGNAYLYTIVNSGAAPRDVAVAPKIEFAVGNGELGFGGYYQRTLAPRFVALYSASIREVDVFGEAVMLYGSDRVFVRPSRDQSQAQEDPEDDLKIVLDTFERPTAFFGQMTAGFRYLKDWEDTLSLAAIGQYFFNGEGYSDSTPGLQQAAARLLANPAENGLTIDDAEQQPEGYQDPPALAFGDLTNWGRHYLGLTLALSNILDTDLGVTAFALVNMSDWSGIVTPAVSYRFLDQFNISASARFTFGDGDDEYTDPAALLGAGDASPTFGVTVSLSMPGGSF